MSKFFFWSVCCTLVLFMFSLSARCAPDSLFVQLDESIKQRDAILKEKLELIERYKSDAVSGSALNQFDNYLKVYDEYKSLSYDSAFAYARKLQALAYALNDPYKIAFAKMKLSFVQVSSGLFKEALDTLQTISARLLPDTTRSEYYYLMARTQYDLSDFNRDDFYSTEYTALGNLYMDSAMQLLDKQSTQYLLYSGLKHLRLGDASQARKDFEILMNDHTLTDQQLAVVASTLSFIYKFEDEPRKAKEMLVRAAIADIHSSTKETLAMLNLADMLNKEGDIERAYRYVKVAMDDANYYGARHRKVQVAAVFPIIEGRQLSMVESKRKMLLLYSSVITALSLITIAFAVIIYKQFQKLKVAKKTISEANDILTETNHQLVDANKIKEEYISYYFSVTADYISKLDGLKKTMEMKLLTKRQEDLKFVVDNINIKRERDDLYHNFDKVFLKLFPDFVTSFNSFFKPEDRIHLKDGQLLNTELRIFALIRMGIHDNDKIAKILDYSVTTIYTYKTRIRNKSILPNEEFDRQIMLIRAI